MYINVIIPYFILTFMINSLSRVQDCRVLLFYIYERNEKLSYYYRHTIYKNIHMPLISYLEQKNSILYVGMPYILLFWYTLIHFFFQTIYIKQSRNNFILNTTTIQDTKNFKKSISTN